MGTSLPVTFDASGESEADNGEDDGTDGVPIFLDSTPNRPTVSLPF